MHDEISSMLGSHLFSNVVFTVLTLMPAFIAHCLYAGHAGSITIISSPGSKSVVIDRKTPNLAPGVTMTFSELIFASKFSLANSANFVLNSGNPFAGPYFPNPLSYTSDSDFFTLIGG